MTTNASMYAPFVQNQVPSTPTTPQAQFTATNTTLKINTNERCSLKSCDPRTWKSDRATVERFVSIFVISFIALLVTCLISRYPAAAGVFTTVCAVVVALAFIATILSCIKYCRTRTDLSPGTQAALSAIDSGVTSALNTAEKQKDEFFAQIERQEVQVNSQASPQAV